MKIINSLLLLDDTLRPPASFLGFFLLLKSCVHVVQDVWASDQSNYHPKFSLNTLVLFPKLTVIINSFAHKVARNKFSMKHSFFSSIYCLLTLCMSSLVCQVAISQSSLYLSFIDSFIDSITFKSINCTGCFLSLCKLTFS